MEIDLSIKKKVHDKIKEISHILCHHEKKSFFIEGIRESDWCGFMSNSIIYVIVPSPNFKKLILSRGYLTAILENEKLFGTGCPWDVLEAIKKLEKMPCFNCLGEYAYYLRHENMAYIFEVKDDNVSDRVLRLDLFRGIVMNKLVGACDFQGGMFHAFKHFTIEDYDAISYSSDKGYVLSHWNLILQSIILNFFSDDFQIKPNSKDNTRFHCIAKSKLPDGKPLKGIYFKEDKIPVYFLNTLHRK